MEKKIGMLFLVLALSLALMLPAGPAAAHIELDPFVTDLIADGGSADTAIDVGDVSVWNDGTSLYVQYDASTPWLIAGTAVDVETSYLALPQNKKGNPKVGHFEYKTTNGYPGVAQVLHTIPLPASAGDSLYIAAHAQVVNPRPTVVPDPEYPEVFLEETAWGEGPGFTGRNWAMYFTYEQQDTVFLTTGDGPVPTEDRIVVELPSGTTLGDINTVSWDTFLVSGYLPHVDIVLDKDGDTLRDDVLVAEGAYQNSDSITGWASGTWIQTFDGASATYPVWSGLVGTPSVTQVDDTTAVWLNSSGQLSIDTLASYKAGTAVAGVDSNTIVLALEIEVDNWVVQSSAYVANIVVTP